MPQQAVAHSASIGLYPLLSRRVLLDTWQLDGLVYLHAVAPQA